MVHSMEWNQLTYIAVLIFAALLAGKVVKFLRLPNVTGYLLVGLLIGPYGIGIIGSDVVANFSIVSEMAMGFIAFSIGEEFKL